MLATINPDGTPHQVPIVFVHDNNNRIWSPIDGKPKSANVLKRVRNAENNPMASLLLDHYDEDWALLWWIRIEIELRIIKLGQNPPELNDANRAIGALQQKYPQYKTTPVLQEPFTLICMTARSTSSWCATNGV